jgi:addiction module RelE/StbE family toxin
MKKISLGSEFIQYLKKLARKRLEMVPVLIEKILLFNNELNSPTLRLPKLTGNLKEHWAFSIEHDLRIIFRYTKDGNILFVNIGPHDKVY